MQRQREQRVRRRRLIIAALVVVAAVIVVLLAVSGGTPAVVWDDEPARARWPGQFGWVDHEVVAERNAAASRAVYAEREWCAIDVLALPDDLAGETVFEPDVADQLAHLEEPLDAKTREWMAQIVAEMEQRRGITLDSTPRVRVFSFETWRLLSCWRMFHAEETEQLSPDWVLAQLLGYLEPEWTPAMWEHLIWPAVAGVYHPSATGGLITLISDTPLPQWSVPTFSHEIAHALQAQLLDIDLSDLLTNGSIDQRLVASVVLEGEAETSMLNYGDPIVDRIIASHSWGPDVGWPGPLVGTGILGLTGPSVVTPYETGRDLVTTIERESGAAAVNALLREPPDSYEQVLHREKLRADEQPAPIEPLLRMRDAVLRASGEELPVDTLGEALIADLISFSTVDTTRAKAAAAGWAVDAITLVSEFEGEPAPIVIWQIAFDDIDEHAEGIQGLREWLVAASGQQAVAGRNGRAVAWNAPSGAIRVVNHANLVWIVAAAEQRIADELTVRIFDLDERWSPPERAARE